MARPRHSEKDGSLPAPALDKAGFRLGLRRFVSAKNPGLFPQPQRRDFGWGKALSGRVDAAFFSPRPQRANFPERRTRKARFVSESRRGCSGGCLKVLGTAQHIRWAEHTHAQAVFMRGLSCSAGTGRRRNLGHILSNGAWRWFCAGFRSFWGPRQLLNILPDRKRALSGEALKFFPGVFAAALPRAGSSFQRISVRRRGGNDKTPDLR